MVRRRPRTADETEAAKRNIKGKDIVPFNMRPEKKAPNRYDMLITGELKVEDLDDQEVFRGQLKNASGDFRGRPPLYVPREFIVGIQAEQAKRFNASIGGMVAVAMSTINEVLTSTIPQTNDAARIQAAFRVLERFAGKVPDKLLVEARVEWQEKADSMIEIVYDS